MNGKLQSKLDHAAQLRSDYHYSTTPYPDRDIIAGGTAEYSELHPNQTKATVKEFDVYDVDQRIWAKVVKPGSTGNLPADIIGWVCIKHDQAIRFEIQTPIVHDDPDEPY